MIMQHSPPISDRRRTGEIVAVTITGLGKILFMDVLDWRLPYITFAIVVWVSYVVYRSRSSAYILRYWGFRIDNARASIRILLPIAVAAIAAFFAVGYYRSTINLSWHILPVLILYPLWGTIQQFLVIGLVAGNLRDLPTTRLSIHLIVFLTALLFGVVHYPSEWLMLGTFLLAILYGYVYLRVRNVIIPGLFHGWLGALFFYTVVDRDPFLEVFGKWVGH